MGSVTWIVVAAGLLLGAPRAPAWTREPGGPAWTKEPAGPAWASEPDMSVSVLPGLPAPDASTGEPAAAGALDLPVTKNVATEIPAPGCCPVGLAFDGQHLWVADRKADTLFRIDRADGRVLDRIPTPGFLPTGLTWDGKALWVADSDQRAIFRIDPATRVIDRVLPLAIRGPRGLAWMKGLLVVGDARDDRLHVLDPHDGTVIRSIPAPYLATTGLTFDGQTLWVADRSPDEIYRVEPEFGTVTAILDSPGPHPWGLAWDGTYLWSADYQTRRITRMAVNVAHMRRRSAPKSLRIGFTSHFFAQGPGRLDSAELAIAIPSTRYNQDIVGAPRFDPPPDRVATDQYGQQVAAWSRRDVPAGTTIEPHMDVDVTLYRTRALVLPEKMKPLSSVPADIKRLYTKDGRKYRLKDPVIQRAAREAVGDETNAYWMARRIYDYVHEKLSYKLTGGWDAAPLLLERGTGSCSEYSFVFIALCRAAGIPARYVGGIVTRGDDAFVDNVFHRWAEVYLPGVGWIPVDADRGDQDTPRGKMLGFGMQDNTLLITTVGGGESNLLDWKYNAHERWTFRGQSRVYVEHIGELSPRQEEDLPEAFTPIWPGAGLDEEAAPRR